MWNFLKLTSDNQSGYWFLEWIGRLFLRVARPARSKLDQGLRDIAQATNLFLFGVASSLVSVVVVRSAPDYGSILGIGGLIALVCWFLAHFALVFGFRRLRALPRESGGRPLATIGFISSIVLLLFLLLPLVSPFLDFIGVDAGGFARFLGEMGVLPIIIVGGALLAASAYVFLGLWLRAAAAFLGDIATAKEALYWTIVVGVLSAFAFLTKFVSPEDLAPGSAIGGHVILGLIVKLAVAVWLLRLVRRVRNGVNAEKVVENNMVRDGREMECDVR
jgi:hypothetical protein